MYKAVHHWIYLLFLLFLLLFLLSIFFTNCEDSCVLLFEKLFIFLFSGAFIHKMVNLVNTVSLGYQAWRVCQQNQIFQFSDCFSSLAVSLRKEQVECRSGSCCCYFYSKIQQLVWAIVILRTAELLWRKASVNGKNN